MKTQAKNTAKAATAKAAANGAKVQNNAKAPEMTVVKPDAKQAEQAGKAMSAELAKPVADMTKAEARKLVKGLNLEGTLAVITDLHRKKRQRDNLIETTERLKKFKLQKVEDLESEDDAPYNTCTLTIRDDERREFVTTNPVLIAFVIDQLAAKCESRLVEVEAEIVLPAA